MVTCQLQTPVAFQVADRPLFIYLVDEKATARFETGLGVKHGGTATMLHLVALFAEAIWHHIIRFELERILRISCTVRLLDGNYSISLCIMH